MGNTRIIKQLHEKTALEFLRRFDNYKLMNNLFLNHFI